ncbi:MAG: aldo/keto reductase [Cyclobacteriaceae bacterium]|nr:aldo/keto reductase [Cyclobacteriaceae bacterium]
METRILGNTGLKVSRIGIGMAALGRPGYINLGHAEDLCRDHHPDAMEKHSHTVLDTAWERGIRYFDAARSYGKGEKFLGNWIRKRRISRGEIAVGSKWGYAYTAEWKIEAEHHEIKEHSEGMFRKQYEESLANLGDYLNVYQIHSATEESGVLDNKEVLSALIEKKQNGLYIGLSLSGERQVYTLEKALNIRFDGVQLFDTVQVTWNILENSTTELLKEAKKLGLGVIVKEAMANGRLSEKNQDADFSDKKTILAEMAGILDSTMDALAIAAVLHQDWADVVLSGAATPSHLISNLNALDLNISDMEEELKQFRETPSQYWKKRSALRWN